MSGPKNEKSNWGCDFCKKKLDNYEPDSMNHVLRCDEYISIRSNLDLTKEGDVVEFYTKVVKIRNDMTLGVSEIKK